MQAQTAASLEATYGAIGALAAPAGPASNANALLAAMSTSQAPGQAGNSDIAGEIRAMRDELRAALDQLRLRTTPGTPRLATTRARLRACSTM